MGRGAAAFVAWVATTILASGIFAGFLGRRIEGQIPSRGEWNLLIASIAVAVAAIVLTIRWAIAPTGRTRGPAATDDEHDAATQGDAANEVRSEPSPRRRFLLGLLGLAGGTLATAAATWLPNRRWHSITAEQVLRPRPPATKASDPLAWSDTRIAAHRRLGRTDARISDIALAFTPDLDASRVEELAREAIARGVDCFLTWPDEGEAAEIGLGRALQGRRDGVFVSTGFCLSAGHLPAGTPPARYVEAVEQSLRRLGTDHVDLVQIHGCNSIERLLDPRVHEAFSTLREQGKARFLGVSSYAPELELVALGAIESGRFDVLTLAYHAGAWPRLPELIERAAARDVGVLASHVVSGALHGFPSGATGSEGSYTRAAYEWALSNPALTSVVARVGSPAELGEALSASGGAAPSGTAPRARGGPA